MMMEKVGVVRNAGTLNEALSSIKDLKSQYAHVAIQDKSKRFNTDLLEAHELGCLLDCAEATAYGALARQESRGGHYRDDFEARDDVNWLAHTLAYSTPGGIEIDKKPVTITRFQPKERKY
jgi:succinate dehydrogenase / fumarate reductase flavoprotein subunit